MGCDLIQVCADAGNNLQNAAGLLARGDWGVFPAFIVAGEEGDEKQILRCAYPNARCAPGPQARSAQDDKALGIAW